MSADEENTTSSLNHCNSSLESREIIKTESNDANTTPNCESLSASAIMEQWRQEREAEESDPIRNRLQASLSSIKWFFCDICEYKSAYLTDLKAHIRVHTGDKPYKCNMCDYRSAHPSSMKKHSRRHTGEKPYVCNVCSLTFAQRTNMKRHQETHTGEKKYECDICHIAYAQLGTLKVHYRNHTGEKPYKCPQCEYCTTHHGALRGHKQIHSEEVSGLKRHHKKINEKKIEKIVIKEEIPIDWDDSTSDCQDSLFSVDKGLITETKIEPK